MRRTALVSLLLLAAPAALAAQGANAIRLERDALAIRQLSETRRIALLPNETVGFRILGATGGTRTLRVTTGHLVSGRLYHAVAHITPRDGSSPLRAEGTVSIEAPRLSLGALPAGEYIITMHLEDLATGSTRDARNKVVLR